MVDLAPFDVEVALLCSHGYDPKAPMETLAWKGASFAVSRGLDIGLDEPRERDRLLAPHPVENPHTQVLNDGMRMFNEVVGSPQMLENLEYAARQSGRSWMFALVGMLIERFAEVHGPLAEARRMPQYAGLVNHSLRFALMLSRDHPEMARQLRAEMASALQTAESAGRRRKPFWKFW